MARGVIRANMRLALEGVQVARANRAFIAVAARQNDIVAVTHATSLGQILNAIRVVGG